MLSVLFGLYLVGCTPVPPDPAYVADICEDRARAAEGPTGDVTIGASTHHGGFVDASVEISSDFLRGLDPIRVYERCVFERTGDLPIRPPVLRNR
jgi:hypothetical protein